MKAILRFNLDDFDDTLSHNRCVQSLDLTLALWEIRQELFKDKPNIEAIREIIDNINFDQLIQ